MNRLCAVVRCDTLTRRGSKGHGWLGKYYKRESEKLVLEEKRQNTPILPPTDHKRKKAFFEFQSGEEKLGTVIIELADDLLPKTSENFLKLCTGDTYREGLSYNQVPVHRIMKNQFVQMGDVDKKNGSGNHSAFESRYFEDEGFFIGHIKPGVVSMANAGSHKNASQFFITLKALPHLDGRNIAFGQVTSGLDVIENISKQFILKGVPVNPIIISACGVVEN